MNKAKKYLFFVLICSWAQLANAYILNQTKSGIPVHWPSSSPVVNIFVNSQNSQTLPEATVQSIAAASLTKWNGLGQVSIQKNVTTNKNQVDLNELYFSTDPNAFNGTGVIGVTEVGFKEATGEIIEADILINDTYTFSTNPSDQFYLGNVITHEAGHFLGLGHGQVTGSTMFYALSLGQSSLGDDDKAGLYAIYPNGDSTKGILSGTIVGGKNLAVVFGAHVQAISIKTGKVMGASISELNGKFTINGLPKNDQYIIYTSPITQIGLPTNYASVRSDFCESSRKYRGSFFQSCGSSSEGFPQSINFNSSTLDVGKITIRCNLDSPPEYLQSKGVTPNSFDISSYTTTGLGGSFVGFFSSSELTNGSPNDYFHLDLSPVSDWSSISSSSSLFVELKILNQPFYSIYKPALTSVKRASGTTTLAASYIDEGDGWINMNTVAHIPIRINPAQASDNDFEFGITAVQTFSAGIPYAKIDLFPDFDHFEDSLKFYLATATVVKRNDDGSYTQVSSKSESLTDNTQCPDAINTYALTNYSAQGTPSSSDRKKALGCGTVDMDNGGAGGPGGFMVGLFFCFIVSYALSRYSKMA